MTTDDIVTLIILSPFLLFLLAFAVSTLIGSIQNAILRQKEFTPEEKSRLERTLKEKDELYQKEISQLEKANKIAISNIQIDCDRKIISIKEEAEIRIKECINNARYKEKQSDHQIFTLKAQNQALTKEIENLKIEKKYIEPHQSVSLNEFNEYKAIANKALQDIETAKNLKYWFDMADEMNKAIMKKIPRAFMDKRLLSGYIKSIKTTRLPKALHEEMKIDLPLTVSATVQSFNDEEKTYNVSLLSCNCKDFENRNKNGQFNPCKHMIALAIKTRALAPYTLELNTLLKTLDQQVTKVNEDRKKAGQYKAECKELEKTINKIKKENSIYYPWFSDLISRYETAKMNIRVRDPMDKRKLEKEIRHYIKRNEELKNKILVYEKTIPLLVDLEGLSPQEFVEKVKEKKANN